MFLSITAFPRCPYAAGPKGQRGTEAYQPERGEMGLCFYCSFQGYHPVSVLRAVSLGVFHKGKENSAMQLLSAPRFPVAILKIKNLFIGWVLIRFQSWSYTCGWKQLWYFI